MCTLSLFNITDENIIFSVRLPFDQKLSAMEMLRKEKVNDGDIFIFIYSRHVINRKKIIFRFALCRCLPRLELIYFSHHKQQHCTSILETISHQINNEFEELSAHRLLSIFKMAEVQIILPEVNRAANDKRGDGNVLIITVSLALLVNCRWSSYRAGQTWR